MPMHSRVYMAPALCGLQVDGWAEFRAPARIGVLVRELRAGVAMLLGRKVKYP